MRARFLIVVALLVCAASSAAGSGVEESVLSGIGLPPFSPAGVVETYSPDTLWERINGEAELYRQFGLTSAAFRHYALPGDPDQSVEIAVYNLETSLAAFGLFSSFKPDNVALEHLGNGSAVGEYQGYLHHGSSFAVVEAFGPPDVRSRMIRMALEAVASRLGPVPETPPFLAAVMDLLHPESLRYRPDHLLGRRALPPGLEGPDAAGTVFFVSTEPVDGGEVIESYGAQLRQFEQEESAGMVIASGKDPSLGPIVLAVRGGRLAGARSLEKQAALRKTLEALLSLPPP
jgi:hypothetical protein